MTSTAQRLTQGSLRFRPRYPSPGQDSQAWKALVGISNSTARFSLLPETKPRISAFGSSLIAQICLVLIAVSLPMLFPQQLIPRTMYMVTDLAGPPLDISAPPKPKPPAPPKVAKVQSPLPIEKPAPKPDVVKFFAPKIEAPKPKARQVAADLPKVNDTFQPSNLTVETTQPARPREPVRTGLLTSGSSAESTIAGRSVEEVQTGGFGDPNGVAGPSNPNKRANVGQFGNSALPPGPGYGNGSGGANGARGVIASTGFGNGVAIPPSSGARRTGTVQAAGFTDSNDQVVEAPRKKVNEDAPVVEPVVILAKPKPVYSAEAIKLNLEGEVLLDVVFPASGGEVQVDRVIKGLGHGLDEAAVRAAQQIKFKPAISGGLPVDFPAVVHIVFQIAY